MPEITKPENPAILYINRLLEQNQLDALPTIPFEEFNFRGLSVPAPIPTDAIANDEFVPYFTRTNTILLATITDDRTARQLADNYAEAQRECGIPARIFLLKHSAQLDVEVGTPEANNIEDELINKLFAFHNPQSK